METKVLVIILLLSLLLMPAVTRGTPAAKPVPADTGMAIPVWEFCHGRREGLETAVITCNQISCEEGPIPQEITPEEAEKIRSLAINGIVTGKANDTMVTGGTWVYTFKTPEGEYLLSVELYKGLLVGSDGMYHFSR